jgi:hypothetical protein
MAEWSAVLEATVRAHWYQWFTFEAMSVHADPS